MLLFLLPNTAWEITVAYWWWCKA